MNKPQTLIVKELWLEFFNRTLFEKGTISEKEYIKMRSKIKGLLNRAEQI